MREVVIIQEIVPPYRQPFFQRLIVQGRRRGLRIRICHGPQRPGQAPASIGAGMLRDECFITTRHLFGGRLTWQPVPALRRADLVIVEQANRHLLNYWLLLRRSLGWTPRLAMWTHGRNWQLASDAWRERFKRQFQRAVDFWFCYSEAAVAALPSIAPPRKISVDNAIDTTALRTALDRCSQHRAPQHLLYIGSLRAYKRLPWVLDLADDLRQHLPDLQLTIVGDGPERDHVRAYCARRTWATYAGAQHGSAAAPYLKRATAILMPGLVGLVALDSFVAETPLLTTLGSGPHSPEYSYLDDGSNALISQDDPQSWRAMVLRYLTDPELQDHLRSGCRAAARRYSIEAMVSRFLVGIERCLSRR